MFCGAKAGSFFGLFFLARVVASKRPGEALVELVSFGKINNNAKHMKVYRCLHVDGIFSN